MGRCQPTAVLLKRVIQSAHVLVLTWESPCRFLSNYPAWVPGTSRSPGLSKPGLVNDSTRHLDQQEVSLGSAVPAWGLPRWVAPPLPAARVCCVFVYVGSVSRQPTGPTGEGWGGRKEPIISDIILLD